MKHSRLVCFFAVLLFSLLAGCGGMSRGSSNAPALPISFSQDAFRPNYGGDLKRVDYFAEQEITYRIVTAGAQDIQRNGVGATVPTDVQIGSIQDAFKKVEAELAKNEESGRRAFRQVPEGETALIDVVVQTPEQFTDTEDRTARGATNLYVREDTRTIGRAVVRVREYLSERVFRSTAMHEALHACGLSGHSRKLGVILQPQQFPILPELKYTQYDSNTIRANYTR